MTGWCLTEHGKDMKSKFTVGFNLFLVIPFLAGVPLPTTAATAASPQRSDLFEAGKGGYATYRIPGIVMTKSGTILAYCEARKNGTLDWDQIDVMLRRSADGGKTWDEPRVIATTPPGSPHNPAPIARKVHETGLTTNNPVAIADPISGAIHFLYCINYQQCFYMRSEDDGKSFSPPVEITRAFEKFRPEYEWKVLATGPGHGIRLSSGRLLVPVWLSLSTGDNAHHPSCVSTIYSDDDGKTWNRGDIVAKTAPEIIDPNETTAAALGDGHVMLNMRSDSPRHRRLISISPDGATDWSKPSLDDALFEPVCFASLVTLPGSPDRLVFSNPDSSDAHGKGLHQPRRNLTIRFSPDGGKHWPMSKVLEAGVAGYSDLAAGPDETIYCLFERGGLNKDMFHTQFLTLAQFNLDWITNNGSK